MEFWWQSLQKSTFPQLGRRFKDRAVESAWQRWSRATSRGKIPISCPAPRIEYLLHKIVPGVASQRVLPSSTDCFRGDGWSSAASRQMIPLPPLLCCCHHSPACQILHCRRSEYQPCPWWPSARSTQWSVTMDFTLGTACIIIS